MAALHEFIQKRAVTFFHVGMVYLCCLLEYTHLVLLLFFLYYTRNLFKRDFQVLLSFHSMNNYVEITIIVAVTLCILFPPPT
ncbi:hypothetical protein BDF20DRAFT_864217 [Mycotypha africana]|uniref:uncharacterized protein n=1 Tax=Mycotypha africana TaxID=64632 RepID=UPI0023007289|nr:uncharacterized protein BDF20DRAFT_864217 [Mycotypha africana]KAI8981948.1 hypothetical protein BDF20DRAFT_864217 [Mycotypha africana]